MKRYQDQADGTEAQAGRRQDKKTQEKTWRMDRAVRRQMGFTLRTRGGTPNRKPIGLTAKQRVKLWKDEAYLQLDARAQASGLFPVARSVKSVASRLREAELHPERADAIRARP